MLYFCTLVLKFSNTDNVEFAEELMKNLNEDIEILKIKSESEMIVKRRAIADEILSIGGIYTVKQHNTLFKTWTVFYIIRILNMYNLSPPNDGPALKYCFGCGDEHLKKKNRSLMVS